ncbi:MAG: hypothetical protein ABIH23_05900 [bacterium]
MKQQDLGAIHVYLYRPGPARIFYLDFWKRHPEDLQREIRYEAKPLEFKETTDYFPTGDPAFRLNNGMAQELMDQLWSYGVRPANFESLQETEAVKDHLKTTKDYADRFWSMIEKMSNYK